MVGLLLFFVFFSKFNQCEFLLFADDQDLYMYLYTYLCDMSQLSL